MWTRSVDDTFPLSDFAPSRAYARNLSRRDPLRPFRNQFYRPAGSIYFDGNSLGLMCKAAERSLKKTIDEWRTLGIRGWLEACPPWFHRAEILGAKMARLMGANENEVVATGATTVNIYSAVSSFYRPNKHRSKILADPLNFPTDLYALKSWLKIRERDPDQDLVLVESEDGRTLSEDRIIEQMTDEIDLVFLPSVLYRSGQLLDMERLTAEARRRNIIIGFDCSHSAGIVPHHLHEWGVDFALWCSYKYLNGGPGSPAFLYIHESHHHEGPGLTGWFGYVKKKQFHMLPDFIHEKRAGGWQISTPSILGMGTLEGSLDCILEAGIERIREKSIKMTEYFIAMIDRLLADPPYRFSVGSPRMYARRGGHVALERKTYAREISEALRRQGIIPDFRPPSTIRFAPVPLYTTYEEIWQVIQCLKESVDNRSYRRSEESESPIP